VMQIGGRVHQGRDGCGILGLSGAKKKTMHGRDDNASSARA